MVIKQNISTSWGEIEVQTMDGKVVGCTLPQLNDDPEIPFAIKKSGNDAFSRYVRDLFQGRATTPPIIGTLAGTPFQTMVWNTLTSIPNGETRTYSQIARSIGHPRSCRAVAKACGRNPVPLFIPCHRVIGADGSLRGFSSGIAWKKKLLAVEK